MSTPRPRTLTINLRHGLANRLRVLISARVLADASQRELIAYWVPSRACGCAFSALFQNAWNIKDAPFPTDRALCDLSDIRWNDFPDLLAAPESDLTLTYYGWLLRPDLYPTHVALASRYAEWFAQLEPTPAIAARVCEFRARHWHAPMIGVHLRRGDLVSAFPNTTNNTAVAMRAVEQFLARAPDAHILLCTDDGAHNPFTRTTSREGVREKFSARFGARVLAPQPRSLDRGTPEAIQDALVELWLLRQTDFFVGTAESSFSELAVLGRTVPYVMTSHPEPAYARLARFLAWTRLARIVDRLSINAFGRVRPATALWFYYRKRARKRIRAWWGERGT